VTSDLFSSNDLAHVTELPVLGVPVRFASNSELVMREVEGHYGVWRQLPADLVGRDGVEVRIVLQDPAEGPERPIQVHYHVPDVERFIIHTSGSVGVADAGRHRSIGYVSRDLVEDRTLFRYAMLNGLTLRLVTARDRHPVHAAVVGRGSTAVVLAGPTGVGKSTLAYQAYLHGLRVLSDDSAYVQTQPAFRVWGLPGQLQLLAESRGHFGDLQGMPSGTHSGRDKIAVELNRSWLDSGRPVATRVAVCRLERSGGPIRCSRATREELMAFLEEGLGPHAAFYRASMAQALSRLCANGGWQLALSPDPSDAIPHIERMLTELDAQP
jgi:hypothetical protein